ncbi:tRNA(Ile)(2)-agmatinylcytidine synthase [Halalkalicoccus sp. NIPERK01]|uniref:tRNA(Ile)(2)-agmatinylcytidine synthase n=1 Tax=Halalkalicoccus sp. NIPERK01 TaxID=3053469 RepID=UPI00256F126F|nr:tRNA(Ile)(2)-agmatinylcytidine synthase [Halalkalicoccus sp. NIPERK01]MDL5362751.1 tRNA(Ile)(2)-agmatinylcytidine synthase [Halalkalicoccus sp. NIPERK01]
MTVVGIDDTDSRMRGMCTTHLASEVADALVAEGASVDRLLLVRLNPAIEHKTRGNAALAIHTDCDPEQTFELARERIGNLSETDDPNTQPGLVVAPGDPAELPSAVVEFARRAVGEHLALEEALVLLDEAGYSHRGWAGGRGRIGALAAVGAHRALSERTYELIAYRERERWGTPREVDPDSVFAAAETEYPDVWDTVDRGTGDTVCVPRTPGPVLYGIRGDDPGAIGRVAERIESEPVARRTLFVTNQGTDAHLREGTIGAVENDHAYRLDGTVSNPPETRRGGHVFLEIGEGDDRLRCAAFEPTKRFRDRVRALRMGDRLTVCGEVSEGTLKLEKFAVRELNRIEYRNPRCPDCGRSMESAGRGQGYRCRRCGTSAERKAEIEVDRDLDRGWYEVPPTARRHVAKPLVRGGFDGPVHPER